MAMGMRYRAGAMGIPFMPIRSMLGSDVGRERRRPGEADDLPLHRRAAAALPALNPDVALIHVQRCDRYGNAQIDGLQFMDIDLAMAANRVILTTERIISNDQIRRAPDQTKIPFFTVDAVVEAPYRQRAARVLRPVRAVLRPSRLLRAPHQQGPGRGRTLSRRVLLRARESGPITS